MSFCFDFQWLASSWVTTPKCHATWFSFAHFMSWFRIWNWIANIYANLKTCTLPMWNIWVNFFRWEIINWKNWTRNPLEAPDIHLQASIGKIHLSKCPACEISKFWFRFLSQPEVVGQRVYGFLFPFLPVTFPFSCMLFTFSCRLHTSLPLPFF